MKLILDIYNNTDFIADKKNFVFWARKTLKKCGVEENKIINIGLNIISACDIAEINNNYRKINKPTDILSFDYTDNLYFANPRNDLFYLGEIFIAPDVIRNNAKKHKIKFEKELNHVFIHGLLHLLKYEHEGDYNKRVLMENIERSLLLDFKNKKMY